MKPTGMRARAGDGASDREPCTRAMRVSRPLSELVLALGLLLGGCTAIVESNKNQCESDDDCTKLFGGDAPVQCVANYCVGAACDTTSSPEGFGVTVGDAYCKGLGFPNSICGITGQCQPGCVEDSQCGDNGVCWAGRNRCRERECTTAPNCNSSSPSMQCNSGICEDRVWGCIGQRDNRPAATMPTATMRVPLVDAIPPNAPVLGAKATACPDKSLDSTDCANPLPGTKAEQDPVTGVITVTGLPQNVYFRLKIEPPAGSDYRPVDFYTQMRARDVMTTPPVTTVTGSYLALAQASYGEGYVIRPDYGGLFAIAFGCDGAPAEGLTLDIEQQGLVLASEQPNSFTLINYFENRLPSPYKAEKRTDSSGLISVVNARVDRYVPIKTSAYGQPISTTQMRFLPTRVTVMHLYPRDYSSLR